MPVFEYEERQSDGHVERGAIEADSRDMAIQALQQDGGEVISLRSMRGARVGLWQHDRIKEKDVVIMSRGLSVMISASIPLVEALRSIAEQTPERSLRIVLLNIANEIEGGAKLSDALQAHVHIFGAFYVNMVRSGETSGQLNEVLEYLADQLEKDYDVRAKIKGAMIYPAFILTGLVVVGFLMMSFVIPKLTSILEEADVALPFTTRMLIAVSQIFEQGWWIIGLGVVCLILALRIWIRTPLGRYQWDGLKIRIPIFGPLLSRMYVVRFARSLETLHKGGVDMVSALEIVADVMGNAVWKKLVYATIQEVNDGNSITAAFRRSRDVPRMMVQMLDVGERTGKIQEVLRRLSNFFSREMDNTIGSLVSLIEPIVMILLGLGVGVMVSAILLPLYNLSSAV